MIHNSRRGVCELCVPVPKILTTDYTDKHGWLSEASFTIRTNPSYPWFVVLRQSSGLRWVARKSRAVTLIRHERRL
jgi:hypothetical protein